MTRQQKLDAKARELGYSSYHDYRNALAQQLGYANYNAQRKARATGVGLRPGDVPAARRGAKGLLTPRPVAKATPLIAPAPLPTQPSQRTFSMADHLSSSIRLEYKKLQGVAEETGLEYFDDKFHPRSPIARRAARDWAERVGKTTTMGLDYLKTGLPDIYKQAALSANPDFAPTDTTRAALQKLQLEAGRGLQEMDRYAKRDISRFLSDAYDVGVDKSGKFLARNGIKGIRYSEYVIDTRQDGRQITVAPRHTVGNYSDMLLRSNAARTWNSGTLAGLAQAGVQLVEVSDGSDCGWNYHRDSEKALGKLVTIEEALDHLIAHPYCVRTFSGRPDLKRQDKDRKLSNIAKATAVATAAVAGLGVANLVADMANAQVQAALRTAAKQDPHFQVFDAALTAMKQRLEGATKVPTGQLYDFISGLPIVENEEQLNYYFQQAQNFNAHTASEQELADLVLKYQEPLLSGQRVPKFVMDALGIAEDVQQEALSTWTNAEISGRLPFPMAVGSEINPISAIAREMDAFSAYNDAKYSFQNMANTGTFTQWLNSSNSLKDQFFKAIGGIGPDYAHVSLPKIGGERAGRIKIMTPDGLLKFTSTKTKDRIINRLTFNSNGMLRAGFTTDPTSGAIIPNVRLIPKGPLRVHTVVNRSRTGKILSVSGDISTRFKLPIDYNAHFRIKLDKLGLNNFQDILKLKPSDIKRLKQNEPELWTWAKEATELRLAGTDLAVNVQPLNLARVNQVGWENAKSLWEISNLYVRDQIDELSLKLFGAPEQPKIADVIDITGMLRDWPDNPEIYERIVNWDLVTVQEKLKVTQQQAQQLLDRAKIQVGYRLRQLQALYRGNPTPPPPGQSVLSKYFGAKDAGIHQVGDLRGNAQMLQDARTVGSLYDDRYPGIKSVKFIVEHDPAARPNAVAFYDPSKHQVTIQPLTALQWDTQANDAALAMIQNKFWAPGGPNQGSITTVVHEFAHTIYPGIVHDIRDMQPLLRQIDDMGWPLPMPKLNDTYIPTDEWFVQNHALIRERLSMYAGDNIWELLAEAMTEYLSSPSPRPLANMVGKFTDSLLIRKR